jgi:hypothetical protein
MIEKAQGLLDEGAGEVRRAEETLRRWAGVARQGADALCTAAAGVKGPSRRDALLAESARVRVMAAHLERAAAGAGEAYAIGRGVCIPTDGGDIQPAFGGGKG